MAFDEIREKIFESLQGAKSQLDESELYQKVRERYELLPPVGQKAVLALTIFLVGYVLFQVPMAYYSRASENLALFEENRDLVLDLYRVKRKSASAPPATPAMDNAMLESRARSAVMGARVQPEQIKAISFYDNAGARASRSRTCAGSASSTGSPSMSTRVCSSRDPIRRRWSRSRSIAGRARSATRR